MITNISEYRKSINEAQHIDRAWIRKEMKDFEKAHDEDCDGNDFIELAEKIAKHANAKLDEKQLKALAEHLSMSYNGFTFDTNTTEIYDFLFNDGQHGPYSYKDHTDLKESFDWQDYDNTDLAGPIWENECRELIGTFVGDLEQHVKERYDRKKALMALRALFTNCIDDAVNQLK